MTRARAALHALLVLCAATTVACDKTTGVYLTIEGGSLVADQLRITADTALGPTDSKLLPASSSGTALKWPVTLIATLPSNSLHVSFTVVALQGGQTVGNGTMATTNISPHHVIDGSVTLTPGTTSIDDGGHFEPDLATTPGSHDMAMPPPPDLSGVVIVPNAYSRTITVHHGMVSAATGATALSSYPLLVSATMLSSKANGGHVDSDTGSDLRFTATGATCGGTSATCILDHEIERYDPVAGVLVAWVRVPVLATQASPSDTVLRLYYGNPTPPGTPSATAVWDGSFRGVWHLGNVLDSTLGAHNGTATGTTTTTQLIGNGLLFNGINDYVEFPDSAGIDVGSGAELTLSMWVKTSQSAVGPRLVSKRDTTNATPGYELLLHASDANGPWQVQLDSAGGNDSMGGRTNVADGNWHFLTVVRTSGKLLHAYEDGTEGTPTTLSVLNDLSNGLPLRFGATADATVGQFFAGSQDEVRLSSAARSLDWVATDYASQKPNSMLVEMGAEVAP